MAQPNWSEKDRHPLVKTFPANFITHVLVQPTTIHIRMDNTNKIAGDTSHIHVHDKLITQQLYLPCIYYHTIWHL